MLGNQLENKKEMHACIKGPFVFQALEKRKTVAKFCFSCFNFEKQLLKQILFSIFHIKN